MRIQSIIPLPLALVVAAGCGVSTTATDESHQAIEGGTADTGHSYVGLLWRPDNREACTGTLITPQIVMTAAHCFNAINTGGGMPVFYTGQGIGGIRTNNPNTDWDPSRDPTLTAHPVQTWTIANGFVDNCPNKNDLALVLLSSGVYATYFGSYAHAGYPLPGAGTQVLGIGYGDHNGSVGSKYYGDESIVANDATDIQVQWGTDANKGFAGSGDSGGPLIYNNTIIGTTMCHNTAGNIEYYQRLDQLASWVDGIVAQWMQPCYNTCGADWLPCNNNCFCLSLYFSCMRSGCGHAEPIISCRPPLL